jgi:hypothetical protein
MAADILVFPGSVSATGLASGADLVAQDFLLAMLNYGEARPYLPAPPVLPITQMFLQSGNVPAISEVALAFNLSMPGIGNIMREKHPGYRSASLIDIRLTGTPGEIALTIRIRTATITAYVQKTLTIGISDA